MNDSAESSPSPCAQADPTPTASVPTGSRRHRRGGESGAAILEFALVIPLFLFMVFGLVTYGVILAEKQKITNTAADAARSAVASPSTAVATAKGRITSVLGTGSEYTIGPDTAGGGQPKIDPCEDTAGDGHQCITVTITYNYGSHPLMPSLNIPAPNGRQLHLFAPNTITSTAKARIQ